MLIKKRRLDVARYTLAVAFFAFGIWNSGAFDSARWHLNNNNIKWVALAVVLYSLPLAGQLVQSAFVRVLALWVGVFLVLQTIATPFLKSYPSTVSSFVTLPANQEYEVNVIEGAIPGIVGTQRVTTDELGFRVTPRVDYSKKSGLRIFAIGGSTTEDIFLGDGATWTHLLQENLKVLLRQPVEVINTGVAGLRAEHHLATLKAISAYQPDFAIILVGVNDWNRAITASQDGILRKYFPYYRLSFMGETISEFYSLLKSKALKSSKNFVEDGRSYDGKRNSLFLPDKREYFPDAVSSAYAEELARLARECKTFGGQCIFLTQPHGYDLTASDEFKKSMWMTPPFRTYTLTLESMAHIANLYNRYLIDFAQREGLPVFDLAAHMEPGFHSFHDDVHFNTEGAAMVAQLVAQFFVNYVEPVSEFHVTHARSHTKIN